jgi:hypothetical protein
MCDTTLLLHHEGDCRHHMPSDRSRLPMSRAFVERRLGTSLLKKAVQTTVRVLYHILVNGENFISTVVYFLFGSTLANILENVRRSASKFLILL